MSAAVALTVLAGAAGMAHAQDPPGYATAGVVEVGGGGSISNTSSGDDDATTIALAPGGLIDVGLGAQCWMVDEGDPLLTIGLEVGFLVFIV